MGLRGFKMKIWTLQHVHVVVVVVVTLLVVGNPEFGIEHGVPWICDDRYLLLCLTMTNAFQVTTLPPQLSQSLQQVPPHRCTSLILSERRYGQRRPCRNYAALLLLSSSSSSSLPSSSQLPVVTSSTMSANTIIPMKIPTEDLDIDDSILMDDDDDDDENLIVSVQSLQEYMLHRNVTIQSVHWGYCSSVTAVSCHGNHYHHHHHHNWNTDASSLLQMYYGVSVPPVVVRTDNNVNIEDSGCETFTDTTGSS